MKTKKIINIVLYMTILSFTANIAGAAEQSRNIIGDWEVRSQGFSSGARSRQIDSGGLLLSCFNTEKHTGKCELITLADAKCNKGDKLAAKMQFDNNEYDINMICRRSTNKKYEYIIDDSYKVIDLIFDNIENSAFITLSYKIDDGSTFNNNLSTKGMKNSILPLIEKQYDLVVIRSEKMPNGLKDLYNKFIKKIL